MRVCLRTIIGFSQLILAGIGAAQVAPAAPSPLLGSWEAVNRSVGGLGSTIGFGPDNTLSFTMGAMADLTYRRSGDTLFVTSPERDLPAARIAFVGDTLIVTTNGKQQRETRGIHAKRAAACTSPDSHSAGQLRRTGRFGHAPPDWKWWRGSRGEIFCGWRYPSIDLGRSIDPLHQSRSAKQIARSTPAVRSR